MKTVAIIPARYNSSRFVGKPLADLNGRPMIWWTYQSILKSNRIHAVHVATDDGRIAETCRSLGLEYLMTSEHHRTSTDRVYEASKRVQADCYVCVNGDEPLISAASVDRIVPDRIDLDRPFVANLMRRITSSPEVVDSTNIKVVVNSANEALYMSRSPIPYPKGSLDYAYYKHVGVLAYNKEALRLFADLPIGRNERVEDVNELRFIDNGVSLKMIEIEGEESLSVDTPKDLEHVREHMTRLGLPTYR